MAAIGEKTYLSSPKEKWIALSIALNFSGARLPMNFCSLSLAMTLTLSRFTTHGRAIPSSGPKGTSAGIPQDPADRIIAATALTQGATLITADAAILEWPGQLTRHDAKK